MVAVKQAQSSSEKYKQGQGAGKLGAFKQKLGRRPRKLTDRRRKIITEFLQTHRDINTDWKQRLIDALKEPKRSEMTEDDIDVWMEKSAELFASAAKQHDSTGKPGLSPSPVLSSSEDAGNAENVPIDLSVTRLFNQGRDVARNGRITVPGPSTGGVSEVVTTNIPKMAATQHGLPTGIFNGYPAEPLPSPGLIPSRSAGTVRPIETDENGGNHGSTVENTADGVLSAKVLTGNEESSAAGGKSSEGDNVKPGLITASAQRFYDDSIGGPGPSDERIEESVTNPTVVEAVKSLQTIIFGVLKQTIMTSSGTEIKLETGAGPNTSNYFIPPQPVAIDQHHNVPVEAVLELSKNLRGFLEAAGEVENNEKRVRFLLTKDSPATVWVATIGFADGALLKIKDEPAE